MNKEDRSSLNPFTGKKHLDLLNDDNFLKQSYVEYNKMITRSNLLDNTSEGQLVIKVATNLIKAIENYLIKIGRFDYIENYYDWEFHLVSDNNVNAFCMPGGKIVVFSGLLSVASNENELAFILAHEISHALLDHSRTQQSANTVKNGLEVASLLGSIALDLTGHHDLANITRGATIAADIGSELFILKPFGRSHELEADKLGMLITYLAGYDIHNIPTFWQAMSTKNSNNHDFFSTHPSDAKRIDAMKQLIIEMDSHKDFYSSPLLGDLESKVDDFNQRNVNSSISKISDKIEVPQVSQPTLGVINKGSNNGTISRDSNRCAISRDSNNGVISRDSSNNVINQSFSNKNRNNKLIKDNFCTNCGYPVSDNSFFCTNCGHKLNVNCPKCGFEIKPGAKFCTNCGYKCEF